MAHEVYISYSPPDQPAAYNVCALLESREVACWVVDRDAPLQIAGYRPRAIRGRADPDRRGARGSPTRRRSGAGTRASRAVQEHRFRGASPERSHHVEDDARDAEEDRLYGPDKRGDELPAHLADRTNRRARLAACKQRLEEQAMVEAAEQQSKIEERRAQEAEGGREKRGRKPHEPDSTPEAAAKANVTDPDSRIMKTRSGYVQGYNSQAVVTEGQIVIAAEVTSQLQITNNIQISISKQM